MTTATQARPRPRPAGPPRRPKPPEPNGLAFGLFLIVNAVLFIRPSDVLPALEGVELYQYAILCCLAVGFPAIIEHLQPTNLEKRPIDLCVMLLLPVILMSHLVGGRPEQMLVDGFFFFKIVVYYLLFVSLVTTPARLRLFCACLILFACAVAVLAAMDFHKVIKLPRGIDRWGRTVLEDETRMYGPGIFQDPNDVCVLITASLLLLLGRLADVKAGLLRWGWLVPLGVLGYGLYLTRSRGGMLALLAGLAVMGAIKWGWRRVLLLGVLLGPLLAGAVLLSRGVDLDSHQDSGQTRVQLWNEGLGMLRANPLFGKGMNRFHEDGVGHVAHNSYIHAFGELGMPGGVLFLAAVWLALEGLLWLCAPAPGPRPAPRRLLDPELGQVHPYVAGCVAAYAAGMFSLTLNYLVVTYTFLGMASMVLATAETTPPRPPARFEASLWMRMLLQGVAFLIGMFLLIRLLFRA